MTKKNKTIRLCLIFLIPLLILSILVAVGALKRNSDIINQSQNETAWYVMQLTKEFAEFNYQLKSYQAGSSDHNDVMLQYEILWSRFKTILNNSMIVHLNHHSGVIQEISIQFENLKGMESQLMQRPNGKQITPLLSFSRNNYDELTLFLHHKFRLTNSDLAAAIKATTTMKYLINYMLIIALLLGATLFITLLRESRNLHRLAMYDGLTQIHNRFWLNQKLDELAKANHAFRFYLIDLDEFKNINDTLGHQAGDDLLITIAKRLKKLIPQGCEVARLGGDEFAVIEKLPAEVRQPIDQQILSLLAEPAIYADQPRQISASIGCSEYPKDAKTISTLLQLADFAMYEVKQQGKNGLKIYTPTAPSYRIAEE
ncbi:hypothetical protein ABT56_02440 [Photobacterium aquae]|uniref:GGDEF domain-containing protein n=1 Tax=Photobacterium aquae TaxID=1195763 RepID=A0A0J1HBP3_9GAMM|nr:GGDEF domain-containing protein [Photobacterium aquae]KLV09078.1 hypothetical protein ABT56_02440 [Photobacterium aquae]